MSVKGKHWKIKDTSKMGHVAWNKGLHKRLNNALEIWRLNGGTKKGTIQLSTRGENNPMKRPENRLKISLSKMGSKNPMFGRCGTKHPNYRGTTSKEKIIRTSDSYKRWRTTVFEKDSYTCQMCGIKCGEGKTIKLNAHHILPFQEFETYRKDIENGKTLCERCHHLIRKNAFFYIPKFLGI